MTDLKPEDLGEASALLMDLARRFMLGEIIGQTPYAAKCAVAMEMVTKDLADRARMEKALREIAEDFDGFAENKTTVEAMSLWRSMAFEQAEIARQALGASQ